MWRSASGGRAFRAYNRFVSRDVLALLKAYGKNTTSFQLLEPGIEHWFSDNSDAFVGYADTGSAWVVLGEPVARDADKNAVLAEFVDAARHAKRRLRFFAVESADAGSALKAIRIGEQPEWEPGAWQAAVAGSRSLREQLRRARAKGVLVSEVDGTSVSSELELLADQWRQSRQMATMRFAVRLDLFHHATERRYFVARRGTEVVGAVIAVPIYARDGWLLEDMLRGADAPNGTSELLIDAAFEALGSDGHVVSMGLAPLCNIESRMLRAVRAATPWLFDWHGLRAFKSKLGPSEWRPVYAAWPPGEVGISAMADILRGFAGGGLLRFAVQTCIHRRAAVLWLFSIMLVPWIALLASPSGGPFFPSEEVRAGWVLFDIGLFAGFASLARRFTKPLAQLLAIGAALDAGAGLWQVASWNAERASAVDWIFLSVSIAAPIVACLYLVSLLSSSDEPGDHNRPHLEDPIAT